MKALIYNPFWDTMGGGERYTATFAKMLLEHGWTVDILWSQNLSTQIKSTFGLDLTKAKWINSKFNCLLTTNYQLLFWLSDGSLPVSLARKTIIHLQFPFAGIGGNTPANWLKSRFYTFVANSGFTKTFIDREYSVVSHIIHPPIDTAIFHPGKKQKIILYVGRFSSLTQKKGQEILIDSFSRIYKKIPGWKLVLAGGTAVGTSPEYLKKLKQSAAGKPIEIIPDLKFSELKKLYSSGSIFWSASGFGVDEKSQPTGVEHFGISLVEAMASGCVPVVSNLGGHKEIVTQGVDGFLFAKLSELTDYTLALIASPKMMVQLSTSSLSKSKMFGIDKFYEKAWDLVNIRSGN